MLVTPNRRLTATLASMAAVTTAPGRRRTIQSKTSNGANGRPTTFHPRNDTAVRTALSRRPTSAPSTMAERALCGRGPSGDGSGASGTGYRGRLMSRAPARGNRGHVCIHDRRQIQGNQLRHDQPAYDGEPERTPG